MKKELFILLLLLLALSPAFDILGQVSNVAFNTPTDQHSVVAELDNLLSWRLLIYFGAAALAGLVAGMLGGGVGLILIPTLVYILRQDSLPGHMVMHVAIGVTVAAISIMGTIGSYSHSRQHTVNWPLVVRMLPGLGLGIIGGSLLAKALSSNVLISIFGYMVLLLALYTLLAKDKETTVIKVKMIVLQLVSLAIGAVGSVFGVSPIAVPFFKHSGMSIKVAVGTGLVLGTIMAYGIVVMYVVTGWGVQGLPAWSTGYVDWSLVVPISIAGSIFAPLGARLAYRMPKQLLKVLFVLLLILVAIHMIWTAR